MTTHGGVDVYVHVLLASALFGGEWSAPRPGRFTPGGCLGSRSGLELVARCCMLHRQTYPTSYKCGLYASHFIRHNANLSLCLTKHYAINSLWDGGCRDPRVFSALDESEWSASRSGPAVLPTRRQPSVPTARAAEHVSPLRKLKNTCYWNKTKNKQTNSVALSPQAKYTD
jgi:hypothetical protein